MFGHFVAKSICASAALMGLVLAGTVAISADALAGDSTRYRIALADGSDGDFRPWDEIANGRNIGLNRSIVEAVCAANGRMRCRVVQRPYEACITGDPNVFGDTLGRGAVDGCLAWFKSDRRTQIGAEFSTSIGGVPTTVLVRNAGRADELPDSDDAIANLTIGVANGFAADKSCLQRFYPGSPDFNTDVRSEAEIVAGIGDGGNLDYAWLLVPGGDIGAFVQSLNTSFAHTPDAAKSAGAICGAGLALIVNPESRRRVNRSSRLRIDFNCGMALLAARSEIGVVDFTSQNASNVAVSDTDFRDLACGGDGNCTLDTEIPLPTFACKAAQERSDRPKKRRFRYRHRHDDDRDDDDEDD